RRVLCHHPSHFEISFIDGHWLNLSATLREDFHDLDRLAFVFLHPWRNENAFGTKPAGGDARHGGADAEFSGFITRGANHAALSWGAADNNRFASERGIIPLLDRGVEGIHIEMEDNARHCDW